MLRRTIKSKESLTSGEAFSKEESDHYDVASSANSSVKYDLVGKIVEETGLTRKAVVAILQGIQAVTFNQIKDNPEEFIIKASATDLTIQKTETHVGPMITENKKDATCSAEGYTGDTVCTFCNNVVVRGTTIGKKPHQWDVGTVTKNPTCTEKGVKTFRCANCTETKTESIAALGHGWGGWKTTK